MNQRATWIIGFIIILIVLSAFSKGCSCRSDKQDDSKSVPKTLQELQIENLQQQVQALQAQLRAAFAAQAQTQANPAQAPAEPAPATPPQKPRRAAPEAQKALEAFEKKAAAGEDAQAQIHVAVGKPAVAAKKGAQTEKRLADQARFEEVRVQKTQEERQKINGELEEATQERDRLVAYLDSLYEEEGNLKKTFVAGEWVPVGLNSQKIPSQIRKTKLAISEISKKIKKLRCDLNCNEKISQVFSP